MEIRWFNHTAFEAFETNSVLKEKCLKIVFSFRCNKFLPTSAIKIDQDQWREFVC